MEYYDKDGNKIEEELFSKEQVDSKIGEMEEKVSELEASITERDEKITEIEKVRDQQKDRYKGKQSDREKELEDKLEEIEKTVKESSEAALNSSVNKKIEELSGGNKDMKEMLEIEVKEMGGIKSVEDVDRMYSKAFTLVRNTEEGKTLLDNISSGATKGESGGEGNEDKKMDPKLMTNLGVSQDDIDEYEKEEAAKTN